MPDVNPATHDKPLILLVDDVPANLHVLAAALKAGYRIKTATSGPAALELLERDDKPLLVLLDVMMPGMSGIEVLRRMRQKAETRDIPVIFISADTSEQSQLDGLELGADDYLTKPVVTSVLLVRVRNILQRKRAETQLRLAAHVFEHSGEAIIVTNHHNDIIEVNPAFTRLTGYTLADVLGKNPRILSAGHTDPELYREMWEAIHQRGFWQGEMWDRNKDGNVFPKLLTITVVRNARREIDFHLASFADISQQKATEERIRHVAHHDPLTGLPNRLHLQIALEQSLALARRERREVALMFIDLDRFKIINDTLGHNIGDGLLVQVAQRLKASVRESDLVARLGGDEFVVVLSGEPIAHAAVSVAEKILGTVSQPYQVESHALHTTPSIGISLYPQDGGGIDALMKSADTAMYHAKEAGRCQFHFYKEAMNRHNQERLTLENHLHQALELEEFLVYYQPQADVQSGRLVGAEALIRWQHPERGLLTPDAFIPTAEDNGLIMPIGEWVLRQVCRQIHAWREAGLQPPVIAVNLSARQFRQDNLVDCVRGILSEAGIAPASIELEITESAAMDRAETATAVFHALHELGVGIAIDDFGTGYSSLSYLKRFPVDKLKIDRSFIMDIPDDPNDAAIAQAIIHMAAGLGLQVVAEGVETEAQRDFLRQKGCDFLQGYWFDKPMPGEAFAALLGRLHAS
ncbi:MAG: EAL domain-containing protein [Methylococcaceae bacterium]|nr:MAG: EAL domain-containing protein [Methylococcaceae bacterium]